MLVRTLVLHHCDQVQVDEHVQRLENECTRKRGGQMQSVVSGCEMLQLESSVIGFVRSCTPCARKPLNRNLLCSRCCSTTGSVGFPSNQSSGTTRLLMNVGRRTPYAPDSSTSVPQRVLVHHSKRDMTATTTRSEKENNEAANDGCSTASRLQT